MAPQLTHHGESVGMLAGRIPNTVEAFLTTNLQSAVGAQGHLNPEDEEALQALLDTVAQKYAPPVLTGTQLFDQLSSCRLLSTGCHAIDAAMLRGGMRGGQMVEVCGESASGKTQLCLAATVLAARESRRVVYVDTSNALRAKRLRQVADAQAAAGVAPQGPAAPDPLRLIEIKRCYDVHALLATLGELMGQHAHQRRVQQLGQDQPAEQQAQQEQQQRQQQQAAGALGGARRMRLEELPVSLLIVDSLSALISPILGGGQHSQGHALLATAAISLKSFAAASEAAVLVTNHLVGGSDERRHEKRPAMGESWRNQPSVRIQLWRPSTGGGGSGSGTAGQVCTATLRASPIVPAGVTAPYVLGEQGLCDPAPAGAGAGGGGWAQPMQH